MTVTHYGIAVQELTGNFQVTGVSFHPNKVMELASLQDGMGSDRARSAADAARI
jgi:hypothetical protein